MSKLLKISVLLLLFFLPLSAVGMEGVVVYYRFGCDYYIIPNVSDFEEKRVL